MILVDEFTVEETIEEPSLVLCGFPMHYRNCFHAIAQDFIRLPLILRRPEFSNLPIAVSERVRSWGNGSLGRDRRFRGAAVVGGSTGAGLTNLLYAPKDAAVVRLSPRETRRSCYLHLSAVTEHRFTWCLGSFLPEARASSQFPQLPYEVEEDNILAVFEMLEEGRL